LKQSFFSSSCIGLDIQPEGICLIQLKKRRKEILIESMACQSLDTEIYVASKIKHWAMLQLALTDCVHLHGLEGRLTSIAVPINLVHMGHLTLPVGLQDKEVEAEVYEQLRRDLLGVTEVLSIDFTAIPQADAAHADIFFAAARQEYLTQYKDCVCKADLKVRIVDVDLYALIRALCFGLNLPHGIKAMIYARLETVFLIIFNSHEIMFHQRWHSSEAQDCLAQIKTQLQIFHATFCGLEIKQLLIYAPPTLVDTLQQLAFSYPLQILNPFAQPNLRFLHVTNTAPEKWSDYLIAFGLALRDVPKW
jgi:Tfp pilus assembly PilM family ATPase